MGFEKEASSSSYTLDKSTARENTPLLGNGKPLSGQFKSFANIFIATVGCGVLGLPYTFKRIGWLTGLLMLFSVAALCHYCMMLLIHTRRKMAASDGGFSKIASFGDVGFAVCGSVGRFVVDILIIFSQAGFCVGYLIFIGTTLADCFDRISTTTSTMNQIWSYLDSEFLGVSVKSLSIWGCLPFQLGLNSIKTLTLLAPLSIFADVIELGAIAVVMVEDVMTLLKQRNDLIAFGGMSLFFYGLGVVVYSFEITAMALPLESEMKEKEKFGKVLGLGLGLISLIYGAFGVSGYMAFGEDTMDIITSNLGPGTITTLVQLGLSINQFFAFPLMMNPAFEAVERRFWGGRYCVWLRWLLVLAVILVALYIPNFTGFLSLAGSSMCFTLGFVLPALFHLQTFKEEMGWKQWIVDVGILILGVVLAVVGTWSSLKEMLLVVED